LVLFKQVKHTNFNFSFLAFEDLFAGTHIP
jgi:hypothetical protein